MECNLSKQDVSCEKVLLNTSLEQPASVEISLPDYCTDIERILKCCLTPVVNQKLINADSLIIDGVVYINLLYCDSSKQIKSFEYPCPFNEKTELTNSAENAITKTVTVKPMIDGLSCKAITDRRVQIKYNIALKVNVNATFAKQVVTNIDCEDFEQLLNFSNSSSPIAVAQKYQVVTDNLCLPDSAPEIRNIVRSNVSATVSETKPIGKKAVVKGDVLIDIMYMSTDKSGCQCVKFSLPYAQIIDVDNINENCTVSVQSEVAAANIRPKTNINGEIRNISAEVKVCLTLTAFCNMQIPFIEDAFCKNRDTSLTYDSIEFKKVEKTLNEDVTVTKVIEVPNDDLKFVVDAFSNVGDIRANCENGHVNITGSLFATVICGDSVDELYSFDRSIDFDLESKYDNTSEKYSAVCSGVVKQVEATITNSGIQLKCIVSITCDVIGCNSKKVVTDVSVDQNVKKEKSCLIAFNAKKGTQVWDIAKKYCCSPNEIKRINNLEGDVLTDNKLLVVSK